MLSLKFLPYQGILKGSKHQFPCKPGAAPQNAPLVSAVLFSTIGAHYTFIGFSRSYRIISIVPTLYTDKGVSHSSQDPYIVATQKHKSDSMLTIKDKNPSLISFRHRLKPLDVEILKRIQHLLENLIHSCQAHNLSHSFISVSFYAHSF